MSRSGRPNLFWRIAIVLGGATLVWAQLFSTTHGQFAVSDRATLEMVAFGALPFSVSVLILWARADWRAREPEPPLLPDGEEPGTGHRRRSTPA